MSEDTKIIDIHKNDFKEIISIIEQARNTTFRAVNKELINMYWEIGNYISKKVEISNWGKNVVTEFSLYLRQEHPQYKGFSPQNIWRMKQFYEMYSGKEKLSPLVREITWSNNLLIMSGAQTDEEREFYLKLCVRESYSKRELDRQIESALYERVILSKERNKEIIAKNPSVSSLRDSYVLEFLDIPQTHKENELRKSIILNLKTFILEFGKDFTFVAEEFRVQVGNTDFYIDLLFYNRELSCLVAVELKVGKFKPEHLGQLNFYLEALDRDVKKPHEQPSVGLILCATKDDDVVEYALSRNLSPTLIAQYQMKLIDKKLLQEKLHELFENILDSEEV